MVCYRESEMSELTFKVSGKSESASRIAVKARNFNIIVDEPPALGGEDLGPNPVEYELTALLGCLNVVSYMIAREMGFTINSLSIEGEGRLNPDRLFGKETDDRAGYKVIEVRVSIDADTDEETLAQWLAQVEARCPVSDNLANRTPVEFSLAMAACA